MHEKCRGVVLNAIKYNDRTTIVRVFTDRLGLVSFAVATGSGRGTRQRMSQLMPLSLVAMEVSQRPGRELATMRDLSTVYALSGVYGNPVKNAIALFVSEVLAHCIQQQERDEALFAYVDACVRLLDGLDSGVANFHICFMYHLGAHLGIQPDLDTYRDGYWFDMLGGVFVPPYSPGAHLLEAADARVIKLLSRMTFANMHRFRFTHDQRNRVLDTILSYYQLHNSTLGTLRSPDVLRQLFL